VIANLIGAVVLGAGVKVDVIFGRGAGRGGDFAGFANDGFIINPVSACAVGGNIGEKSGGAAGVSRHLPLPEADHVGIDIAEGGRRQNNQEGRHSQRHDTIHGPMHH